MYRDTFLEDKHKKEFGIYWKNKNTKVKTVVRSNVDSVLENSKELNLFYQEKKNHDRFGFGQDEDHERESLGSLSSADERDM